MIETCTHQFREVLNWNILPIQVFSRITGKILLQAILISVSGEVILKFRSNHEKYSI